MQFVDSLFAAGCLYATGHAASQPYQIDESFTLLRHEADTWAN